MSMLERVRESKSGSWMVATAAYLVATGGAVYLRKLWGANAEADLGGAMLIALSLIVTAVVMRSPALPRWSLLAAAGILSAGMVVSLLVFPGGSAGSDSPIATWSYGWIYLALLGGTRASGPRWCHSPWVVVAASAVLAGIGVFARWLSA